MITPAVVPFVAMQFHVNGDRHRAMTGCHAPRIDRLFGRAMVRVQRLADLASALRDGLHRADDGRAGARQSLQLGDG
jgi:hypothetical protein